MLRQLGALPTIDVSTSPSDRTMIPASPADGTGTITATITLGGGAEGWTAAKSGDDTDAFIESFTPASGNRVNKTLTITYKKNTGVGRSATLTLTTTGGTGGPATAALVFTQLGAPPTISEVTSQNTVVSGSAVAFDPTTEKLAAGSGGKIESTITLGGGATGWEAAKDGDTGNVFITSFTDNSGTSTVLVISYSANADAVERSATINITPTGSGGAKGIVFALVLTQVGATVVAPTVTAVTTTNRVGSAAAVNFDPTTEKLAAASTGTISATITLGGGATGWEAAKDGDTGNAFITSFTDNSGTSTVLEIAYSANADVLERSATINITPTGSGGATGAVFALVLTQLGTSATITVGSVTDADDTVITPTGTTYSVPATAQTLTVPITLTGTAENVSHTATTGDFFTVA